MNALLGISMAFAVFALLSLRKLAKQDQCPNCKQRVDRTYHGYDFKWKHCHECGWCNNCGGF